MCNGSVLNTLVKYEPDEGFALFSLQPWSPRLCLQEAGRHNGSKKNTE